MSVGNRPRRSPSETAVSSVAYRPFRKRLLPSSPSLRPIRFVIDRTVSPGSWETETMESDVADRCTATRRRQPYTCTSIMAWGRGCHAAPPPEPCYLPNTRGSLCSLAERTPRSSLNWHTSLHSDRVRPTGRTRCRSRCPRCPTRRRAAGASR